eukprot:Rmarinus@m.8258
MKAGVRSVYVALHSARLTLKRYCTSLSATWDRLYLKATIRRLFRRFPFLVSGILLCLTLSLISVCKVSGGFSSEKLNLLPNLVVDPQAVNVLVGSRYDHLNVILPIIQQYYPNAKVISDYSEKPNFVWQIHDDAIDAWNPESFGPSAVVNAMPGLRTLGLKPNLTDLLQTAEVYFGDRALQWYPKTFTLPVDEDSFRLERVREPESVWICKPVDGYSSKGIFLLYPGQPIPSEPLSVQRYVSKPLLYQGKYKFDMRMYLLVTSIDPLVIYKYPLGVPRIASSEYKDDREEPGTVVLKVKDEHPQFRGCIHLTDPHYQLERCKSTASALLPTFPATSDELLQEFMKGPYGPRLKMAINEAFGVGVQAVMSLVRINPDVLRNAHTISSPLWGNKAFQLLGLDIIFETDGFGSPNVVDAKLIEINNNPNLKVDDRHPFVSDIVTDLVALTGIAKRSEEYLALIEKKWETMVSEFCLGDLRSVIQKNERRRKELQKREQRIQGKLDDLAERFRPLQLLFDELVGEHKETVQELALLFQQAEQYLHLQASNQERRPDRPAHVGVGAAKNDIDGPASGGQGTKKKKRVRVKKRVKVRKRVYPDGREEILGPAEAEADPAARRLALLGTTSRTEEIKASHVQWSEQTASEHEPSGQAGSREMGPRKQVSRETVAATVAPPASTTTGDVPGAIDATATFVATAAAAAAATTLRATDYAPTGGLHET